jgi:predicted metal-dependent phosphoesterase TrpH
MRSFKAKKEQSNRDLIERLNRAGYRISYESIRSRHPDSYINRAHIAQELTQLGYTRSVQQAFRDLLHPEKGFYREPERLQALDVIATLQELGAVPVLAHPFLNLSEPELRLFLTQAVPRGLIGMEVFYSLYNPQTTTLSLSLSETFSLLPSGGSDYHGSVNPDIALGTGKANLQIPFLIYENLKAHSAL